MMHNEDQPNVLCSFLGSSYVVLVTTSAFNLLALVMNEAYQFYDLVMSIKDSRNCCCVIFGIFTLWFSSIIMNLGVAFIPGNPSYDRKEDRHCIFVYGITRNYVLHMLWIVLVSMAIGCTIFYIRKLHLDIKSSSYYRMPTLIRATVTIDTNVRTASQRRQSQFREKHHVNHIVHVTKKKLVLLILLVSVFIIFWYPLFTLTATDPDMGVSREVYKVLTLLAWSNASATPFLLFFMIRSGCCCNDSDETDTFYGNDRNPCTMTGSTGIEEEQTYALRSAHPQSIQHSPILKSTRSVSPILRSTQSVQSGTLRSAQSMQSSTATIQSMHSTASLPRQSSLPVPLQSKGPYLPRPNTLPRQMTLTRQDAVTRDEITVPRDLSRELSHESHYSQCSQYSHHSQYSQHSHQSQQSGPPVYEEFYEMETDFDQDFDQQHIGSSKGGEPKNSRNKVKKAKSVSLWI